MARIPPIIALVLTLVAAPALAQSGKTDQPQSAAPLTSAPQVQAPPASDGPSTVTTVSPASETAAAPVAPAQPADPNYHGAPYKGALTSPPAQAMDKSYPLCRHGLADNCRNPSQTGPRQRYPAE